MPQLEWEKMAVSDLKSYLKTYGMVQSGEKGTLIFRCKTHQKSVENDLVINGQNPCNLKIGDLRKAVSCCGLSPIGNQDELLTALVDHLMKTK
jgi:hypothetical protein